MSADDRLVASIEALYRADYRRFLRVSLAILRDEQLAHDAVQEGFARALKERGRYRGHGELKGWVWRIVMNASLASRAAHSRFVDAEEVAELEDREARLPDEGGVRAWVSALPDRQRLAVFLRYYADLDYRAIAEALEVEVGTVSATLAAAHETLRRSLDEVSHARP